MGILNLLNRLQEASQPVPSVLTLENQQGTEKNEMNQSSSRGSLGSRKKTAGADNLGQGEAFRLWLIRHADGSLWSHSFTPPATEEEVRRLHPHALELEVDE